MPCRPHLIAAALLALAAPAWAQAPKPDAAAAAAAMERAQRLADNPMRVILQAGKIRRNADAAPATAAATPAASTTTAAASSTSVAAVPMSAVTPVALSTPAAPVHTPAPTPAPAPALVQLPAVPVASGTAEAVTPLATSGPVAAPAALPTLAAPQALAGLASSAQPRLLSMVEPELSARLRADAPWVTQVEADLTLTAEGQVSAVSLVGAAPRSWARALTQALMQWRFEPQPGGRVHRVQLVFEAQ